jgi:hypothetical protein
MDKTARIFVRIDILARKGIVERLHRTLLDDHLRADALHRPKFWRT